MLKMYTSDVCNTGQAFTVQGTPIQWFAGNGMSSPGVMPDEEGLWNEYGAVCLNNHRLDGTGDDAGLAIDAACGDIPSCANFDVFPGGPYIHSKTALPFP
jgi:hypothetical protein